MVRIMAAIEAAFSSAPRTTSTPSVASLRRMSTGEPQASVPDTLKLVAGITWRLLVLAAGLYVAGIVLDSIFPVVFALFFAMLMTAWAQPLMHLLQRFLPKVVSMVLALLVKLVSLIRKGFFNVGVDDGNNAQT